MFGQPILYKPTPPLKQRRVGGRDVVGFTAYQCGRIERPRGADWQHRCLLHHQRREDESRRQMDVQKPIKDVVMKEFEQVTNRQSLRARIRDGVESGVKAFEEDLGRRRTKLHLLLLEDEDSWMRELMDRSQRADEGKLDNYRRQVEEIRAKRIAEDKAFAEEKRLQQYRERCDDIRAMGFQHNLMITKQMQLDQMKHREWLKSLDEEEERAWQEVMKKNVEALKLREEEDARKKKYLDLELRDVLLLQSEAKRKQEEELKAIRAEERVMNENDLAKMREENLKLDKEKKEKQEKEKKALMEQLETSLKVKKMRDQKEQTYDMIQDKMAKEELRKEQEAREDLSAALRKEMEMFQENLKEMRELEEKQERLREQMRNEDMQKMEQQHTEKRAAMKSARQKLLEETIKGRNAQVEYKKTVQNLMDEHKETERQLSIQIMQQQEQIRMRYNKQQGSAKKVYRYDLDQQVAYNKLLKDRQQAEEERRLNQMRLEEERYNKVIEELLNTPAATKPHNFKTLVEGQASVSPPPELPQPPAARLALPCPQMGGSSPGQVMPVPRPQDSLIPDTVVTTAPAEEKKSPESEKKDERHNGLEQHHALPFILGMNMHKPPSLCPPKRIPLPCSTYAGDKSNTKKVEVPCYLKQHN